MAYISFQPKDHFNTELYTGNGSTQSITGVGFQPDLVWIKRRDSVASSQLYDIIRGALKKLSSNSAAAEGTETYGLQSFDSDGFSLAQEVDVNASGGTFVSWNWLGANSSSSNTNGTISSTVSVNDTSGFSIVSYAGNGSGGATIGHGLSTAPKVVIAKNRVEGLDGWQVLCVGYTGSACLNETIGFGGDWTNYWGATNPTSSVFTVGTNSHTNGSGQNIIAYCFAEKSGFSKFGKYTGNGNADGTFVYTGFRPAWVMIKQTSANGNNWWMIDSKRVGYNIQNNVVFASLNNAEDSSLGSNIDILSNGFKLRNSQSAINAAGGEYFFMAFADQPLVTSNGLPSNAR